MRYLTIILSLISVIFTVNAARADQRVAFVVGNGAYENVPQLPNPPFDARAMASLLRSIGFEVIEGTDLTHDQMTNKLLEFAKKAREADVAIFYYAGHGLALDGTNYLLPVDAKITSKADVKLGAGIDVDTTLQETMADAKVKLVLLDACRNDPFVNAIREHSTRGVVIPQGLAEMHSAKGTLIAFATSPGQTALDGPKGTHSPFTAALLSHLTERGVEIQQVMTQVRAEVYDQTHDAQLPWGNTNLIGSVYLNPAPAKIATAPSSPAATPAVTSTSSADATGIELEYWRSVKDSDKPEELKDYLTKYPNGQFKSLAVARLAEIQNGPTTTSRNLSAVDPKTFTADADESTEDQLHLDRSQRRDVQRRLTRLGFRTRITGHFDDHTRDEMKKWQEARGYPVTGYLNDLQHKALLSEVVATTDTGDNSSNHPDRPQHRHVAHYHGRYHGGPHYYHRGGGNPGAFMGHVFGGMMGGMFR